MGDVGPKQPTAEDLRALFEEHDGPSAYILWAAQYSAWAAQMGAAAARKPGECVIGGSERPIKASGLLSRFGLVVDGVPVVVRDEGSE